MARRRTRAEVEQQLVDARTSLDSARTENAVRAGEAKEARRQIDELKERLVHSETERHRLTGYIERVHEDDIVREDLIITGDPEGERRLVPKRKFMPPRELLYSSNLEPGGCDVAYHRRETPRPPKSWIIY